MRDDDDLRTEVQDLRSEITALQRRVSTLEDTLETDARSTDAAASRPDTPSDDSAETQPSAHEPASETTTNDNERERDWERDIGIKWLGVVGGVASVIGVVFFIRVAIEAGLLGPLGRVVTGTVGGAVLFSGGRYAAQRQGYVRWGRITAGVGLVITYFSLYAAYGFEAYRTALDTRLWVVLTAMTVLVAGTVVLSIHDGTPIVAGEAFLLGYATAYLSLDSGTFLVTPAYVVLIALGIVALVTVRPWSRLVVASVLPTYGLVWAWRLDVDPAPRHVAGIGILTFGVYLAGRYLLGRTALDDRWERIQLPALTVLNAGVAAILLESALRAWVPDLPIEGVAFGVVAVVLVGGYEITNRVSVQRDDAAGAFAVILFAGSVVLAGGTFSATVGLLAVLAGAVSVAAIADAGAFRRGSHLVAGGVVLKLLVVDANTLSAVDAAAPLASLPGRAVVFGLAVVAFYGLAWWYRSAVLLLGDGDREIPLAAPYAAAATGLTGVLLGLELSGVGVSVAWAGFGLLLLGGGLTTNRGRLRIHGIIVLAVTTAKVFLFDTRGLDTAARTLSFLVLGSILLIASYAYARWQGEDPLQHLTPDS